MSTISFQCYSCSQVLKVGLDKAGKRGKCPKCGTLLTIPVSSTVAESPPAPAAAAQPPVVVVAPPQPEYPAAPEQPQYPAAPGQGAPSSVPVQLAPGPTPSGPMQAEPVHDHPAGAPQFAPPAEAYLAEEEPRRGAGFPPWARARLGLLLVFIGSCVLAGAFVLELIGYLILSINLVQLMAASNPSGASGRIPAFLLLFRIAEPLALAGSVASLAGYVLCMLGPKQRGAVPLAITTLALGTVHLLMALIFRLAFLYGESGGLFSGGLSRDAGLNFGNWFVLLLTQLFFGAELIMFPFYMRALALIRKKHGSAGACLPPMILAIVYTALRLLGWILFYVPFQSHPESSAGVKTWIWIDIIMLWIGSIVFVIFIILYILVIWRVRRVATK